MDRHSITIQIWPTTLTVSWFRGQGGERDFNRVESFGAQDHRWREQTDKEHSKLWVEFWISLTVFVNILKDWRGKVREEQEVGNMAEE